MKDYGIESCDGKHLLKLLKEKKTFCGFVIFLVTESKFFRFLGKALFSVEQRQSILENSLGDFEHQAGRQAAGSQRNSDWGKPK